MKRARWTVYLTVPALGLATFLFSLSALRLPAFLRKPNSDLEDLYGTSRLIYPRLSIKQAYQPCRVKAQSGLVGEYECVPATDRKLLRRKWLAAESGLRSADTDSVTEAPESNWLLQIASGKANRYLAAAKGLEAEARSSNDVGGWVDASAAYYLAATAEDRPSLLSPALAASEKAIELDPRNPSAAFNMALILESLSLLDEAQEAWRAFIALEAADSPWRAEAFQHVDALSKPTKAEQWEPVRRALEVGEPPSESHPRTWVKIIPYTIRDWIAFDLAPAWANAWLKRDSAAAAKYLALAAAYARELDSSLGEELPSAQIDELYQAGSNSNAPSANALALGILDLQNARASYLKGNYNDTLKRLEKAEKSLIGHGPSFLLWVRYYRAASLDQQGLKQEADDLLADLVGDLEGRPFASLRGRAQALRGRIRNNLGRPDEGIPLLIKAIATLDSVEDAENGAWARTLVGDSYRLLGDYETCWQYYFVALGQISNLGTPLRELAALNAMSDFLLSSGEDSLALHYQDAAVSLGPELGNPDFFADVLLRRWLLRFRLGDDSGALADLEHARVEASKIQDPTRLERFRADLGLYTGAELLEQDPAAAALALSGALGYFEETKHWSRLLIGLEARAQAYDRLKDREAEIRDLAQARDLYVKVGRQVKQDSIRVSFAGRIENSFDQTLRLGFSVSSKAEDSLAQLEQERAINHPILQNGSWLTKPVDLAKVRSVLMPGMALVEYAVLSDRLLVWLVLKNNISVHQSSVTKAKMNRVIARFLEGDRSSSRWREDSKFLGVVLLGPLQEELERSGITSLIIVPDEELFGTPFAALTMPRTGRLLVEDYAVVVSPSASLFAHATERSVADRRRRQPLRALVVANPEINEAMWPHLSKLSSAPGEGAFVERLFPGGADLLVGENATIPKLQSGLAHASWFHFAGHSMAMSRRPLDSYLLLSQSPSHSGRLTAEELLDWNLSQLRGVVLSSCSSAASSKEAWSGAMTLARPFLASGVPMVIGSLWDVEDQESAAFFQDFYRQFALRGFVLEAFHEAQLAALARSRKSKVTKGDWSAFQIFGGPDGPAV